ncbi:YppE family protein [Sporosarcina sp. GW1-11]|uniref:YppE family protein n=1 Tax=Sporosarcina sp. GW1-11 TaxID=2899126 RepID=UPI00294F0A95|nr:YppE family protein [Sporosarcina sp. GW1-11]MDV6377708.1 YppE family protein [Sporosarcina sp. GW1-11]
MSRINDTRVLLSICDECEERFYKMRETEHVPDFFGEVKPYADVSHKAITDWSDQMKVWIAKEKPRYVHAVQIDSLKDSMTQFVVQSFYKETGKKRFILSINAARYTLQTVLNAMANEEGERSDD